MTKSSKPVLILQLRPEEAIADSEYACILKYGELPASATRRLRIETSGIPAELELGDYSAIIVGGSPYDVSTPAEQKSAAQQRVEASFERLLTQVVAEDFPFLGCCSGNGLLGHHLGAKISRRYGEPVSCISVVLTGAGAQDKLLQGFPSQIDVLVGHKEACDEVPPGAELLLRGDACPVQMFRLGENVYATQFHPEGDADEFTLRIGAYKHHGYFAPDEAERLIDTLRHHRTPQAHEILRRFVAAYVDRDC